MWTLNVIRANILALAIVLKYAHAKFSCFKVNFKHFFLSWKRQIRVQDMIHIIDHYHMHLLETSD